MTLIDNKAEYIEIILQRLRRNRVQNRVRHFNMPGEQAIQEVTQDAQLLLFLREHIAPYFPSSEK